MLRYLKDWGLVLPFLNSYAPSFNLRRANQRRANLRRASGDPYILHYKKAKLRKHLHQSVCHSLCFLGNRMNRTQNIPDEIATEMKAKIYYDYYVAHALGSIVGK